MSNLVCTFQEVHEFFKLRLPHLTTEAATSESPAGQKQVRIKITWQPAAKGRNKVVDLSNPVKPPIQPPFNPLNPLMGRSSSLYLAL